MPKFTWILQIFLKLKVEIEHTATETLASQYLNKKSLSFNAS